MRISHNFQKTVTTHTRPTKSNRSSPLHNAPLWSGFVTRKAKAPFFAHNRSADRHFRFIAHIDESSPIRIFKSESFCRIGHGTSEVRHSAFGQQAAGFAVHPAEFPANGRLQQVDKAFGILEEYWRSSLVGDFFQTVVGY